MVANNKGVKADNSTHKLIRQAGLRVPIVCRTNQQAPTAHRAFKALQKPAARKN